ncbi:MAG: hypothetical protein R3F20_11480 [Planctomycetota bacterium]
MRRFAVLLALCLPLATAASEPDAGDRVPWFRGSFDDAVETAMQRNVPLMFVFLTDGEQSSEILTDSVFTDSSIIKDCEQVIPILCCLEEHGTVAVPHGGSTIQVCKRHGSVTCTQHQSYHNKAYRMCFGKDTMRTPTIRLVHPKEGDDGQFTVLSESVDDPSSSGMRAAIRAGVKKMGRGLDEKSYREVRECLTRARNEMKRESLVAAWHRLDSAPDLPADSLLGREIAKLREQIMEEVRTSFARGAKKGLVVYAVRLDEAADTFAKTPIADEAKRRLAEMRQTADGREALKAIKANRAIVKLVEKAEAAETRQKWDQAYRHYRSAIVKGGELPAAQDAAARLAELKEDPGIRLVIEAEEKEDAADALYDEGAALAKKGEAEAARKLFERVVGEYGETKAARKARKQLEK